MTVCVVVISFRVQLPKTGTKRKPWEASRSRIDNKETNTVPNTHMIATIIGEVYFPKRVADACSAGRKFGLNPVKSYRPLSRKQKP